MCGCVVCSKIAMIANARVYASIPQFGVWIMKFAVLVGGTLEMRHLLLSLLFAWKLRVENTAQTGAVVGITVNVVVAVVVEQGITNTTSIQGAMMMILNLRGLNAVGVSAVVGEDRGRTRVSARAGGGAICRDI